MSMLLPAAATLTGTTLVVPGLGLAAGQRVTLLYVTDAGDEIPLTTWHADPAPGTGTGPATTDGLPEGTTNLYFTEQRARDVFTDYNVYPLTLPAAQKELDDSALRRGALYLVDSDAWNNAGFSTRVYIQAIDENQFALYGYAIGGKTTKGLQFCAIDVAAGTFRVVGLEVSAGSGTVLRFDQDYAYAPLLSGTFTVDVTGRQVGKEVSAYLGPATSAPTLPAATFQLLSGAYAPGVELMYTFKVGANGKIQYVITEL